MKPSNKIEINDDKLDLLIEWFFFIVDVVELIDWPWRVYEYIDLVEQKTEISSNLNSILANLMHFEGLASFILPDFIH